MQPFGLRVRCSRIRVYFQDRGSFLCYSMKISGGLGHKNWKPWRGFSSQACILAVAEWVLLKGWPWNVCAPMSLWCWLWWGETLFSSYLHLRIMFAPCLEWGGNGGKDTEFGREQTQGSYLPAPEVWISTPLSLKVSLDALTDWCFTYI